MNTSQQTSQLLLGSTLVLGLLCLIEYSLQNQFIQSKYIPIIYQNTFYLFKYFRVLTFCLVVIICTKWTIQKQEFLDKTGLLKKIAISIGWAIFAYLIWRGYTKSNIIYNKFFVPIFFIFEIYLSILLGWIIPIRSFDLGEKTDQKLPRKPKDQFSIELNTDQGKIYLLEPFRGNLITGSPGCAKTSTILAQQMKGYIEKGFCGVLYDYKGFPPTLGRLAQNIVLDSKKNVDLVQFNLSAPCISKRINLLPSEEKNNIAYTRELTSTLFASLNTNQNKADDYWMQTASMFVEGTMRMLMRNFPKFSTLPHAIAFVNSNSQDVLDIVSLESDLQREMQAVLEPHKQDAKQQMAGIISSAQASLRKLNLPEVFWLLSKAETDLDVNNPLHPKILNVCSESKYRESYGAVCAAVIGVTLKKMNQKNRVPSFVIIDEASTAKFTGTTEIVAQGRENKIALTMVFQSKAQAHEVYGDKAANNILTVPANHFYGMMTDTKEATEVANSFGQYDRKKEGFSMSDSGTNISINTQRENRVHVDRITNLKVREFVSNIADAPEKFITRYRFYKPKSDEDIPIVWKSKYLEQNQFYADVDVLMNLCIENATENKMQIKDAEKLYFSAIENNLASHTLDALKELERELNDFSAFKMSGLSAKEAEEFNDKYNAFQKKIILELLNRINACIVQVIFEFSLNKKSLSKSSLKKAVTSKIKELRYMLFLEFLNAEMAIVMEENKAQIYRDIDGLLGAYKKVKNQILEEARDKILAAENIQDQEKARDAAGKVWYWFESKMKDNNEFKIEFLERLKGEVV